MDRNVLQDNAIRLTYAKYNFGLVICAIAIVLLNAMCGHAVAAPAAGSTSKAISTDAPGGFEALLHTQTTLVDVYYGGRRVGETMASYSPGTVRFGAPGAVLAMLPKLTQSEVVKSALAEDLPTHADRACEDLAGGRCGRLSPDLVGVIFDEAHFRADIFINPAYLVTDTLARRTYLPTTDPGLSVTGSLSGVLSGSDKDGANYSVQANALIAFGSAHLETEVIQSSALGAEIDRIALAVDHGPLRFQAGLLWSPGEDLIGQGRFYGVGVATQVDTLVNHEQIAVNPILIYLSTKAQVDILRAGRILSSQQYEAGNQVIDTTNLPEGSYTITLRIHEIGGYTHEETRSVNKTRSLPPLGLPQYFLAGGLLADDNAAGLPGASGIFLEGGYARRLSISTGVDAGIVMVADRVLGQVGVTYMPANGFKLRAAAITSAQGGAGFLLSSTMNIGPSSVLSLDARQGWNGRDSSKATADVTTDVAAAFHHDAFGLGLKSSQYSAGYTVAWRGGQYGAVASYAASPLFKRTYAYGPKADVPVKIANINLHFVANAAQTDRGVQAFFGFRLMLQSGRRAFYGDAGLSSATGSDGRHVTSPTVDVSGSIAGDSPLGQQVATGSLIATEDRTTVTASGQLRGDHGDFTAQIDHDLSGQNADTRYSAGFVLGGAFTPARSAVGSAAGGTSGVIVDVRGAPAGSEFEVLVNDRPRALIKAGESVPIMLPAYRLYSIRLAPRSATALDFDASSRDVSLYPGNVKVLTWSAQKIVDVFGRVVDENDQPVVQAAIEGAKYPGLTDDHGYFQVDVTENGKLRFLRPHGGFCEIAIDGVTAKTNRISLGTKRCASLTVAAAPTPFNLASIAKEKVR